MKTESRQRAGESAGAAAADTPMPCLWLRNEAGRRGVPMLRSFEKWVGAIPELRERRRWTELNILVVGSARARRFNREFRGRDHATNVLSFPYEPMPGEHSGLLGDLVLCAPVVAREAREQRKAPRDHYAHLTVHGVLHLLGYDHATDRDAARMEKLERRVLDELGIADPYGVRDEGG
jgi:probable rRNA maturation factor